MRSGLLRLLILPWLLVMAVSCWGRGDEDEPASGQPAVLGVLSFRPKPETLARWQPTADYLARRTGRAFVMQALTLPEMNAAVARGELDFVLTNPGHYLMLGKRHALSSPLATLIELANDQPMTQFGGVIFTRAGRRDISRLADLAGKKVAVPEIDSFGGYLTQAAVLVEAGLSPTADLDLTVTGMPQDKVVQAVLTGRADAGFIRTGVLESLGRSGQIDLARIAVLNNRQPPGFPYMVSTRLYPEWPFVATPRASERLAEEVSKALFSLHEDHPAAVAGQYHGWSIPADYEPVRAMLQSLRLPPFDQAPPFTWRDILDRHGHTLLLVGLGGTVIVTLAVLLAVRQRQLRDQEHRLSEERRQILAALGEGVYGTDAAGRCTFANPAAQAMLGYSAEELLGRDQHALIHHHHPDGRPYPETECPIHQTLQDGSDRVGEEWFIRKDGNFFPVDLSVAPMQPGGIGAGAVVVFRDVTARRAARERDLLLVSALEAAANAIVITDASARIEWANPAFETLTGYSRVEAIGRRPAELLKSGRQDTGFYEEMWRTISSGRVWRGEIVNRRRDGSLYDEELIIAPVPDEAGGIGHYVGIKQDISARKRMEEELQALATTDMLTGLPNRRHFLTRLEQEMARLRRFDTPPSTLLMLDLDHFKQINDNHGHAAGDAALRRFAEQMREQLRKTDLAGRLGGEEFSILLVGADAVKAREFAERLRRQVEVDGVIYGDKHIGISVSIGLTQLRPDGDDPDAALARADSALYRAKEGGRNLVRTA